ncbi:hypothetical protein A9Z42_0054610 [Trichoderma parareesei]|uniref:BTB domain-containing protein n=1 Tax=Trichoderma parareesei TaxID=858221 RepID=A0A2H2ZJI0_TRIPA|nr:hypothetical protein A9Z42_0054610 [Trichoderma parareesei]
MFALADKYLIKGLLALSRAYFSEAVAKENDMNILSQHAKQVYDLEFESSKCLRKILIQSFIKRIARPAAKIDMPQSLDRLMAEVPEFARDMAMAYIRQPCLACARKEQNSPLQMAVAKKRRISENP